MKIELRQKELDGREVPFTQSVALLCGNKASSLVGTRPAAAAPLASAIEAGGQHIRGSFGCKRENSLIGERVKWGIILRKESLPIQVLERQPGLMGLRISSGTFSTPLPSLRTQ